MLYELADVEAQPAAAHAGLRLEVLHGRASGRVSPRRRAIGNASGIRPDATPLRQGGDSARVIVHASSASPGLRLASLDHVFQGERNAWMCFHKGKHTFITLLLEKGAT